MAEATDSPASIQQLRQVRLDKLTELREAGLDPFRNRFHPDHTSAEALAAYREEAEAGEGVPAEQPRVAVAGRIVAFRVMGKASFLKLLDRDGRIQCYLRREEIGEEEYRRFRKQDLGDFAGVEGRLFRTKTGEITVAAERVVLLGKSLLPLPEKWHGLADEEQRHRQRYLDLIVNEDSRRRFFLRSEVIREIRQFLWERSFTEVETPVLQSVSGGAAARPFTTHMHALGTDFALRIALELHLKRLLVGGMDRVYELGRVFRNEGLSRRHNPEFTMLELYEAYSDYRGMMELVRSLLQRVAERVLGTTSIERADGTVLELGGAWAERRYRDLIVEHTGEPDWFALPSAVKIEKARALGIEVDAEREDFEISNQVFEKRIEPTLVQPTFVTHLPKELIPLAKTAPDDPESAEVFELCINGQEIAPAYTEQNDPLVQREAFARQAGEEIQRIDEDFLEALEHGMPPAGGMGIGIDRLVLLLTGAAHIRDTILFPPVRPLVPAGETETETEKGADGPTP